MDYFEYQTTAARSYSPRFVELFGRPRNPYEPIDLETRGRAALRRLRRQRPARARGHARGDDAGAASRDRPAGPVPGRRRGAQRRRERADSRRVRLRARVRALRAGRCGLRARGGALRRSHLSRQSGSRRARSSVLGADGRRRRSWRGRRARTTRSSKSSTTRCSSNGSRTSSPPAASSAGWTARPSSARARSAIAAFWRRRTRARCATGSIATSSTARSSGRSRR